MKSRGEGTAVTVTVNVQLSTLHAKQPVQLQPTSTAEHGTATQEDRHITEVSVTKHSAGSLCGIGRLRAHGTLFEKLAMRAALRFATAAAMRCKTAGWLRWVWSDRRGKGIDTREWPARQACHSLERAVTLSFNPLQRRGQETSTSEAPRARNKERGARCAWDRRCSLLGPRTCSWHVPHFARGRKPHRRASTALVGRAASHFWHDALRNNSNGARRAWILGHYHSEEPFLLAETTIGWSSRPLQYGVLLRSVLLSHRLDVLPWDRRKAADTVSLGRRPTSTWWT